MKHACSTRLFLENLYSFHLTKPMYLNIIMVFFNATIFFFHSFPNVYPNCKFYKPKNINHELDFFFPQYAYTVLGKEVKGQHCRGNKNQNGHMTSLHFRVYSIYNMGISMRRSRPWPLYFSTACAVAWPFSCTTVHPTSLLRSAFSSHVGMYFQKKHQLAVRRTTTAPAILAWLSPPPPLFTQLMSGGSGQ